MPNVFKEGSKIPRLSLPDREDRATPLFENGEDFTIVYFYPKDDTPGCTLEAQGFNRLLPAFQKHNARIVGISGGNARTKEKFCSKYGLEITLLSDEDFSVSRKFGAYGPKVFMGRKFEGILRKTFVFDSKGTLIKVYDSVKPEQHPEEVLDFISGGKAAKPAPKAAAKKAAMKRVPARDSAAKKEVKKIATTKKAGTKKAVTKKPVVKGTAKAKARAKAKKRS